MGNRSLMRRELGVRIKFDEVSARLGIDDKADIVCGKRGVRQRQLPSTDTAPANVTSTMAITMTQMMIFRIP